MLQLSGSILVSQTNLNESLNNVVRASNFEKVIDMYIDCQSNVQSLKSNARDQGKKEAIYKGELKEKDSAIFWRNVIIVGEFIVLIGVLFL